MVSIRQNSVELIRGRGRIAAALALLGVLALIAAGCGGGGDGGGKGDGKDGKDQGGKTATEGDKSRTGPRGTKPGPTPKPGSEIKDLKIKVVSKTEATVTVTLAKSTELSLQVKKADGTKVGRVSLGTKPAGSATIKWNLKVEGKQLTPGQYKVQVRGRGAGKSLPTTITIS